jgi:hypothetical protein
MVNISRLKQYIHYNVHISVVSIGDVDQDWILFIQKCRSMVGQRHQQLMGTVANTAWQLSVKS